MELDKRWVLVKSPAGISKLDIVQYYRNPIVAAKLLQDINDHPVTVVNYFNNKKTIVRHYPNGSLIQIYKAEPTSNADRDRTNLYWWVERRGWEFHKAIPPSGYTRFIWIDIDAGNKVPFKKLKDVTKKVFLLVKKEFPMVKWSIRFSGGYGFYVVGELSRPEKVDVWREKLKSVLARLLNNTIVMHKPSNTQIRLDLTTLVPLGSIRANYSLNASTGRISKEISLKELDKIKLEDFQYNIYKVQAMPYRR